MAAWSGASLWVVMVAVGVWGYSFSEFDGMSRPTLENVAMELFQENELCVLRHARQHKTQAAHQHKHPNESPVMETSAWSPQHQFRMSFSTLQQSTETATLVEFFDATAGANWIKNTNWKVGSACSGDVSQWWGVQCASGFVVSITLEANNLVGTLPESLGTLSHLQTLALRQNFLQGTLPTTLSSIISLQSLDFRFNRLTGTLPPQWGLLTNLSSLHIEANKLTGTLPHSWSAMSNIWHLSLWENELEGTLPDSWAAMTSLVKLDLDTNHFVGDFPDAWIALSKLETLALFRNLLNGTLPAVWGGFPNMQNLWLDDNNGVGPLPEEWSSMTTLISIQLSNNWFTGTLPSSWSALVNLERLWVDRNVYLTGTLPPSWGNMRQLKQLRLGVNGFTGVLPSSWSTLSSLSQLWLQQNNLEGTLPPSWGYTTGMTELRQLTLFNNSLEGQLPHSWLTLAGGMPSLSQLDLSSNNFSFSVDRVWYTVANSINFANNALYGDMSVSHLPLTLASYQSLLFLTIAENPDVHGQLTFCQWIGGAALLSLNISGTNVNGGIPNVWRNCFPHLNSLDIRRTQMTGQSIMDGQSNFLSVGTRLVNDTASSGLKQCPILETLNNGPEMAISTSLSFFNQSWCACADRTYGTDGVCHACNWAALSCNNGSRVLLLPGYWASVTAFKDNALHKLYPARCPDERCCVDSSHGCEAERVCAATNRTGVLCGACLPGYSSQYASEACAPNEKCTYGPLLIVGLFFAALLYVLFLVIVSATNQMDPYDRLSDGWKQWLGIDSAITVLGFFYQIVPLLISPYTKQHLGQQVTALTTFAASMLNLSLQRGSGGICLYPNMSSTSTIAFHFVLPSFVLLWLGVVALAGKLYNRKYPREVVKRTKLYGSTLEDIQEEVSEAIGEPGLSSWHVSGRHFYALNIVSQLAYLTTYKTTLALIRCSTVIDGPDLESTQRLFWAGDQLCFASASQWLLLVFAVVLTAVPPLRIWASGRVWGPGVMSFFVPDRLLFRRHCHGWPGVLMLQRLAFVSVDSFCAERLVLRAWLNGFLCAIGAVAVTSALPFRRLAANVFACLAHALLVLLSLPAIANAQLISSGSSFTEAADGSTGPVLSTISDIFLAIPITWLAVVFLIRIVLAIQEFYQHRFGTKLSSGGGDVELL